MDIVGNYYVDGLFEYDSRDYIPCMQSGKFTFDGTNTFRITLVHNCLFPTIFQSGVEESVTLAPVYIDFDKNKIDVRSINVHIKGKK